MLHIVKGGGDTLKCHRHDLGHFVLFLVLTMLKNAFYLSNVPLDQQFVFFLRKETKFAGLRNQSYVFIIA